MRPHFRTRNFLHDALLIVPIIHRHEELSDNPTDAFLFFLGHCAAYAVALLKIERERTFLVPTMV